jgi:hypothetical protein
MKYEMCGMVLDIAPGMKTINEFEGFVSTYHSKPGLQHQRVIAHVYHATIVPHAKNWPEKMLILLESSYGCSQKHNIDAFMEGWVPCFGSKIDSICSVPSLSTFRLKIWCQQPFAVVC